MATETIKEQLHQFIESLGEKRTLAIYPLFEDELDLNIQRRNLINLERQKYLRGEGKSYSFEQVKAMALKNELRNEL